MKYQKMGQEAAEWATFADKGYFCRGLLGQGGFSKVYCVESRRDGGIYACKVSGDVKLLEREAQIMASLQHPLFPEYYEMWQEAGIGLLLMEYVPGCSMEEMLKRRGHFGLMQAVRVGMELAEGLWYLQERSEGFVFRDIKPANSIIRQDGKVKLLDFGCAYPLGEKAVSRAGTPGFAAPEQLRSGEIMTAACDVYGWGQTMKAMLGIGAKTTDRCKDTRGKKSIKRIKGTWSAGHGHISRQLWRILDACTKEEPSERIPDMRSVMAALMPLCRENGSRYIKRTAAFPQGGIICEKNIIIT